MKVWLSELKVTITKSCSLLYLNANFRRFKIVGALTIKATKSSYQCKASVTTSTSHLLSENLNKVLNLQIHLTLNQQSLKFKSKLKRLAIFKHLIIASANNQLSSAEPAKIRSPSERSRRLPEPLLLRALSRKSRYKSKIRITQGSLSRAQSIKFPRRQAIN